MEMIGCRQSDHKPTASILGRLKDHLRTCNTLYREEFPDNNQSGITRNEQQAVATLKKGIRKYQTRSVIFQSTVTTLEDIGKETLVFEENRDRFDKTTNKSKP